ncbi:MAG: tripartite tricarboxylate transporter substrate binding protein [Betaproteobacteria bacterium]|nr:tripartite tricarboxylate transporter substrate binding protein [Betaproteobacteria bacterium]
MSPATPLFLACVLVAGFAQAQPYPAKAIRLIVGIAPGGGLDASTRIVAGGLAKVINQQVLVENRAGAGGTIAAGAVAAAAPDGYTLLYGSTSLMIAPGIYENLTFDPVKSFAPVAGTVTDPLVIAVNPNFPARSTAELITLAKASPGKLSYGSPGVGSVHHLAMELFKTMAELNIVHIPYKGAAGYVPDLIAGILPIAMVSVAASLPQAKAGKLRVIAITSPGKLHVAPDWASLADTLPGFDMPSVQFIVAPAGTQANVIGRLSDAVKTALSLDDTRRAFDAVGGVPEHVPPDVLAMRIRDGVPRWAMIAKQSGAKP